MRAERAGARAGDSADVAQYRLDRARVAQPAASLRCRAISRRAVAASVERGSRSANESVEMWLERGLVALLLLAGAAALIVYNGDSLRRALVQRAGGRCVRHPDDRELEPRDRGLRRALLGVRARPKSRTISRPALDGSHRAHVHGHGARGRRLAPRDAARRRGALHGRQRPRRRRLRGLSVPSSSRSRFGAAGRTACWRSRSGRSC